MIQVHLSKLVTLSEQLHFLIICIIAPLTFLQSVSYFHLGNITDYPNCFGESFEEDSSTLPPPGGSGMYPGGGGWLNPLPGNLFWIMHPST